jgi:hypothetical protein
MHIVIDASRYATGKGWHDRTSLQVATSKNEVLKYITNRRQVHPVGEHALLLRLLLEADEHRLQACFACEWVVWLAGPLHQALTIHLDLYAPR